MSIQRDRAAVSPVEALSCHGGAGAVHYRPLLGAHENGVGIRFVHETVVPPGASIGLHAHTDDEELYLVASGSGVMTLDRAERPIGPGACAIVRTGGSHGLRNTGDEDLVLFVVCVEGSGAAAS